MEPVFDSFSQRKRHLAPWRVGKGFHITEPVGSKAAFYKCKSTSAALGTVWHVNSSQSQRRGKIKTESEGLKKSIKWQIFKINQEITNKTPKPTELGHLTH